MTTTATTADKLLAVLAEHPGRSAADWQRTAASDDRRPTKLLPPWNRSAG